MAFRPPSWPLKLLERVCPPSLFESIAGDLEESFYDKIEAGSLRKANWNYIWSVFRFMRPGILFRNTFKKSIYHSMIGNYVKVASRNISKQKTFTFINAIGLSIGIATCVLIYLFIQDDRRFDRFHSNGENIVRLHSNRIATRNPGDEITYQKSAYLSAALEGALRSEVPEVEKVSIFSGPIDYTIRLADQFYKERVTFVGSEFLSMFSFGMISGDSLSALSDPTSVVLTKSVADKFFPSMNPIGETIDIFMDSLVTFTVTGVLHDVPKWSSLQFDVLLPAMSRPYYAQNEHLWSINSYPIFVQLQEGASDSQFQASLDGIMNRYRSERNEEIREYLQLGDDVLIERFEFLPLSDIHTSHDVEWEKVTNPIYHWILGGIALLILVIACINYVTLALSTSLHRAKEIGIRKSMGASRVDIGIQFGVESLVVAGIALVLALILITVGLQPFNTFVDKDIKVAGMGIINIGLLITGLTLVVGLLAGSYPSIYLSGLNSIAAIQDSKRKLNAGFTRVLVVMQFSLSIFLLVCSMFMFRQMEFLTTKDLGFDKENVLVIPTQQAWGVGSDRFVDRFRTELEMNPNIVAIGGTSTPFSQGWSRTSYVIDEVTHTSFLYRIDTEYLQALDIDIVEGRNFISGSAADSNAIIVNRSLVHDMGWDQPLNENLEWADPPSRIIGVVEDHHFLSLESEIQPMILTLKNGYLQNMYVRIKPSSLPGIIDDIRLSWSKIEPDKPFEFTFLDNDLAQQYDTYEKWSRIMLFATLLAVFIACLGLFGLAGVTTANKTKEIGIRKVLGATITGILIILNRPYAMMMLLAYVLAVPASYYVIQRWLGNFEYAITMEWQVFAISFIICLVLAIGTVSYHAFKASRTNPVDTLKYE